MDNFFTNIWNYVSALAWTDWMIIAILIGYMVSGFKRGLVKEFIEIIFLFIAFVVAMLFYKTLSEVNLFNWLAPNQQEQSFIAFIFIIVSFLLIQKTLYQIISYIASIEYPCKLNKAFALIVLTIIIVVISWYYMYIVAGVDVMTSIITDDSLRLCLSFVVVFALIFGTSILLSKILGIKIESHSGCLLESFFQKVIDNLSATDDVINARNISSIKNKAFGALIGIPKGILFIIITILILQNFDFISQQYYWLEAQGFLRSLQDIAVGIKTFLAKYLLFIKT